MGLFSSPPDHLGVSEGRLAPCPNSPNCVSSQAERSSQWVEPLHFEGSLDEGRERLLEILRELPRTRIITTQTNYIHAEVTSGVFRFVDDLEFLLDPAAGVIHVRSASRRGYSDMGVNGRRVEAVRRRFSAGSP